MHETPNLAAVHEGLNVAATETSLAIRRGLETVASELSTTLPEYRGMTVFGSVARGQAKEGSDADIFVYIEPSEQSRVQANPRIEGEVKIAPKGGVIKLMMRHERNSREFSIGLYTLAIPMLVVAFYYIAS